MKQADLYDNFAVHAAGFLPRLKACMNQCVEESGLSREQALDLMNAIAKQAGIRLSAGNAKALSLPTLEKWLNPAEGGHTPSILTLNTFCAALKDFRPLEVILSTHGCEILSPDDRLERDYGRACMNEKRARKQKRQMEAHL